MTSPNQNFFLTIWEIRTILQPARALERGRFAVVTKCWRGLRWTLWRQAGLLAGRERRSVRRSRVVLAPRPWRLSVPACAGAATVTINAAHRGEHV
jgi:hypothetical protein